MLFCRSSPLTRLWIFHGLCYAVSLLGLSTIISKIYGYDGYYALIVVVLPAFIWGIPKIKKLSAEKKAELSE